MFNAEKQSCICRDLQPNELMDRLLIHNYLNIDLSMSEPLPSEYYLQVDVGNNHIRDKINYCPFCGRKLGE